MSVRSALLCAAFLCGGIPLCSEVVAQSPGKPPKFEIATAKDVFGMPTLHKPGTKLSHFALWYEDGVWHLRGSGPEGKKEILSGSVTCDKGQLSIGGQGLDKAAKPGDADYVKLNGDGTGFQFLWTNFGKVDGMSFKTRAKDATLTFKLRIGGGETKAVLIGEKNRVPAKSTFSFPATPKE